MNVRNKIVKALATRNKEAYIQAANNRFGFKVRKRNIHLDIRRSRKHQQMWKAENNLSQDASKKK